MHLFCEFMCALNERVTLASSCGSLVCSCAFEFCANAECALLCGRNAACHHAAPLPPSTNSKPLNRKRRPLPLPASNGGTEGHARVTEVEPLLVGVTGNCSVLVHCRLSFDNRQRVPPGIPGGCLSLSLVRLHCSRLTPECGASDDGHP